MTWRNLKVYRFAVLIHRGFGEYKFSILGLVILGTLSGFFEGIGVNSLVPLFSLLTNGPSSQDVVSVTTGRMFQRFGVSFGIRNILILIAILFVLRAVVLMVSYVVKITITTKYESDVRSELFSAFNDANWPFLLRQKLGHLETVLMTNVHNSSVVLEQLCASIIVLANLIVYLLIAFNISAQITLMTLVVGVVLFLGLKPLLSNTKKYSHEVEAMYKTIAHFLNENVLGMKTVKAMSVGPKIACIGRNYFESLKKILNKIYLLRTFGDVLMQPVGILFICFLFAVYYKTATFQLGVFAAVIYLIQRIFVYFQQFQSYMYGINVNAPFLQSLLALKEEVRINKEVDRANLDFDFKQALEFKGVSFSYGNKKQILDDISFTLKHGETYGLIGPSGAGKTTLVDLVLRLFEPNSGCITLDGRDIKGIDLFKWRNKIGYVSQDIFLMNDTISANIKFYNPTITDDEVKDVAKKSNIFEFIESLPAKFNTVIGERGVMLSVGQRQRIIIARALARKPELLILDEATSALDNESEIQIQYVIESLKGKITVLVIAHRLSTIMHADKLIVLDSGRIIEEGKPEELLANKDSYFSKVSNIRK
jgi:ABC-type multidrug transport system fused ATPase/permease subunit